MALTIPPLFYIMLFNGEGTLCPCGNACGLLVPLAVNGTYDNPNGGGVVRFNLTNSPGGCGISIARVLSGNLMDLEGRDDFVELNPNSKSMRMRIDWPGYEKFSAKINMPKGKIRLEDLIRKVCDQVNKFIANAKATSNEAPEWMIGAGNLVVEHLVLISLKRITVGSWVPTLRLINPQDPDQ